LPKSSMTCWAHTSLNKVSREHSMTPEAWTPPPRPRTRSQRLRPQEKPRPKTPVSAESLSSASSAQREAPARAPHLTGILKRLVRRWLKTPSKPAGAAPDTPPGTPASLSTIASLASASDPRFALIRPVMLTHEREAAAVSAGLDIFTYNMIMDLQHRDITPEDYETLRRLDSSVQPKTISLEKLECACPRWTVPATRSATSQGASKELCCICLEHFACGDQLRRLPCRHTFHSNCIVEWLTTSSDICPECSQPVVEE